MANWGEEIDGWIEWPAWRPNKELSYRHLQSLEHYLLSRSRILDEDAYGVDLADYSASFGAEFQGESDPQYWSITVGHLRAVTPSGQPVWLTGQRASFKLYQERDAKGRDRYVPGAKIDIFLLPTDPQEPPEPSGAEQKFQLKVIPAPLDEEPAREGKHLYLGRHLLQDDGLKLDRRPMQRRLCAFGPTDSEWETWVEVLSKKIDLLRETYCGAAAGHAATSTLLGAEILEVSREWPFLTIPVLARKLMRINCLQQNPTTPLVHFTGTLRELSLETWTGHELPQLLAQLLPEPKTAAAPEPASMDISAACMRLVQALSQDIEYHAPIGDFSRWHSLLEKYRGEKVPEVELRRIASIPVDGSNSWVKAVVSITRMVLEKGDHVAEVSSHLGTMHAVLEKKQAPAAPMAFFWLAKAATLVPDFPRGAGNNLNGYCKSLRAGKADPVNRLTRYINRVHKHPAAENLNCFYLFGTARKTAGRSGPSSPDVKCVILGNDGSGRTALASTLEESWPAIGGGRMTATTAAPSDKPNAGAPFDLLVLAIAPGETDRWQLDTLNAAAKDRLRASPWARVAIAYTRADEYGVVEFSSIRLAHRGQLPGKSQREFDLFIKGVRQEGGGLQDIKGARSTGFKFYDPVGEIGSGGMTRSRVLSNTSPIWIDAISSGQLLNGYFIAASPAGEPDEYLAKSKERHGVMQLLGDFLESRRSA